MDEFIGEKINVDFVQEAGWKRPVMLRFRGKSYAVKEVKSRWEEHDFADPWWTRKHRVWYEVDAVQIRRVLRPKTEAKRRDDIDDGFRYHLYWDRGPRGKGEDWILVKRIT